MPSLVMDFLLPVSLWGRASPPITRMCEHPRGSLYKYQSVLKQPFELDIRLKGR